MSRINMIICTPDIFFHPISVMDFKKIFSVVVCAVGIFFSMTAESKDECLNSYVSADSLLLYEYYESHIWVSPLNYPRVFSEQRAVAPDWFHYRDRVIELRVLALRKRIWEEYLRDFPLERLSVREIIAMCMNSDWSGSMYIMEHEPDKYDNMYTGYIFPLY